MTRSLRDDDRGLALGIVSLFAILVISALLFILFDPAITQLFSSMPTETTKGQEQVDLAEQIWGLILFFAAFLALLRIVSLAVFESRRA